MHVFLYICHGNNSPVHNVPMINRKMIHWELEQMTWLIVIQRGFIKVQPCNISIRVDHIDSIPLITYLFVHLHKLNFCLPKGRHGEAAHEKRLLCAQKCTRVGWGGMGHVGVGWGGVGHVMVGWGGSCRGGGSCWGRSCRVGWVM